MKTYIVRVDAITPESTDVKTIRLQFPQGHDFSFRTGQYILMHAERNGEDQTTPYSIATTPGEFARTTCIELCVKHVEGGFMSGHMHALKAGASVLISGPLGKFIFNEPPQRDMVFLATGTGVSPLRPMIHRAFEIKTNKHVWLFFGAKTQSEIIWRAEFEQRAREYPNFHYIPTLSREQWDGEKGYVQDVMQKHIAHLATHDFYIAGVKPMVEQVVDLLQKQAIPLDQIHTEKFL